MIGQTISPYRIIAKLGEDGMGAVYRAEDQTLDREIALKFLPAGLATDAHSRLLKEAQAASRLNHPNIVTIYEVNVSEDPPFLSMELVTGQTLKEILQRSAALAPATFVSTARLASTKDLLLEHTDPDTHAGDKTKCSWLIESHRVFPTHIFREDMFWGQSSDQQHAKARVVRSRSKLAFIFNILPSQSSKPDPAHHGKPVYIRACFYG